MNNLGMTFTRKETFEMARAFLSLKYSDRLALGAKYDLLPDGMVDMEDMEIWKTIFTNAVKQKKIVMLYKELVK